MELATLPMPSPDGAAFMCSAVFYPYSAYDDTCDRKAEYFLNAESFDRLTTHLSEFNKAHPKNIMPVFQGRMLCQAHYNMVSNL